MYVTMASYTGHAYNTLHTPTDYYQPASCYYKYTPQEPLHTTTSMYTTVNAAVVTALPCACCGKISSYSLVHVHTHVQNVYNAQCHVYVDTIIV